MAAMTNFPGMTRQPAPPPPVETPREAAPAEPKLQVAGLNFHYGPAHVLHDINLQIPANKVTALIGPSGCGKSTFLRTLNRMHETIRNARGRPDPAGWRGHSGQLDVVRLRRRVGMVFQRPNPFPKSIFDNVAYGLRINGWIARTTSPKRPSSTACTAPRSGKK